MASATSKSKRSLRLAILATIVCIGVVVLCFSLVDLKKLHDWALSLNGFLVFLLMAVLPLVGVPLSILFVVAGAKFGPGWGMALALVAIAFHLVGTWWIGHSFLRKPLDALFQRFKFKKPQIPESEAVPICLLIALVPGPPYSVKNYLMVLGGARFAPYFWSCLPAHFFSATPGILFGDFTGSMSTPKIIFLVVYALLLIGLSHYVVTRLRKRKHAKAHAH